MHARHASLFVSVRLICAFAACAQELVDVSDEEDVSVSSAFASELQDFLQIVARA